MGSYKNLSCFKFLVKERSTYYIGWGHLMSDLIVIIDDKFVDKNS